MFDLRARFFLLLCVSLVTLSVFDSQLFTTITIPLAIYLILEGYTRDALGYTIIISLLTLGHSYFDGLPVQYDVMRIMTVFLRRFLPLGMASKPLFQDNPTEIITTLEKIRLPKPLYMPITFMLRFWPTALSDFNTILKGAQMRGILSFKKPLLSLEYTMVPLLIRSSMVADRLAAAAETRGLSRPGKHTSIKDSNFKALDYLLVLFSVAISAFYIVQDRWGLFF